MIVLCLTDDKQCNLKRAIPIEMYPVIDVIPAKIELRKI